MIVVQNPPKIVNSAVKQTDYEKPTYHDAITGPNKDKWIAAMYEELKGIQLNHTWRLVTLPPGRKAIFESGAHPDAVLLLLKSLYGLKQASWIWYLALYNAIINLGFLSSEFDP